jgi:hypothetical protein
VVIRMTDLNAVLTRLAGTNNNPVSHLLVVVQFEILSARNSSQSA